MEELAGCELLVFPALEELATNGFFIHNDDTVLRIVDTIRHNQQNPDKKRTGMYTTVGIGTKRRQSNSTPFITANFTLANTWSVFLISAIRICVFTHGVW
jgi:hypothetical protein